MSDEQAVKPASLAETLRKMTALSKYAEICEARAKEVTDAKNSGYLVNVSVRDATDQEPRIRAVIAAEWRKIASEQVAEIARLAAVQQEIGDV